PMCCKTNFLCYAVPPAKPGASPIRIAEPWAATSLTRLRRLILLHHCSCTIPNCNLLLNAECEQFLTCSFIPATNRSICHPTKSSFAFDSPALIGAGCSTIARLERERHRRFRRSALQLGLTH